MTTLLFIVSSTFKVTVMRNYQLDWFGIV